MTIYIGIDPGKSGALALINGTTIAIIDTPTVNVGKGSRRAYDESAMVTLLESTREGAKVAIELVHAMPEQGVSSMFSMGEGYGLWRGMLTALRIPWQVVTPQRWKGVLMDGQAKEKAASVLVASRLFPGAAGLLRGPRGGFEDGRADALLIAEWLRRQDED